MWRTSIRNVSALNTVTWPDADLPEEFPMGLLTAAVVIVGALCVIDLLLTVGVIRRLREHTELLASTTQRVVGGGPIQLLEEGTQVADFAATTTDGEPISREMLPAMSVVAFFSPGCKPCGAMIPAFTEYAATLPGGRAQVMAVVVGDTRQAGAYADLLMPVARVVTEDFEGQISEAFKSRTYPALYVLDGAGKVVSSGTEMTVLPKPSMR
jgi:thiol-disulfide isomerase/thioredoxin